MPRIATGDQCLDGIDKLGVTAPGHLFLVRRRRRLEDEPLLDPPRRIPRRLRSELRRRVVRVARRSGFALERRRGPAAARATVPGATAVITTASGGRLRAAPFYVRSGVYGLVCDDRVDLCDDVTTVLRPGLVDHRGRLTAAGRERYWQIQCCEAWRTDDPTERALNRAVLEAVQLHGLQRVSRRCASRVSAARRGRMGRGDGQPGVASGDRRAQRDRGPGDPRQDDRHRVVRRHDRLAD